MNKTTWIPADRTPPIEQDLFLLVEDKTDGRRWVTMGVQLEPGEWRDLFLFSFDPCRYTISHWQLIVYPGLPETITPTADGDRP